jgi:serine/threonine protein kinase
MPEQQPRLLADRYELIVPIGRGTMGTVWRAHDRLLGRDVAVKEIRQDAGLSKEQRAELRERMIREGRIAAKIAHPSVATVHDAILVDGSPWIIMELVEARSLEQVIDEEGPLPARLVAEIGLDLLGALAAAHEQDILHRDVKPGNVLLTDMGRVVLTDFGIAKAAGDSNITKTGMVIGSPGYTAPERARGDHTGRESDLWSLGATLYFAVEGRPAYERGSVSETLAALMTEQADPATQAGPLRPVLEALLEKDYTKRLTHNNAVRMLRAIASTSGTKTATPPGTAAPKTAAPSGTAAPKTAAPSAAPKTTPGSASSSGGSASSSGASGRPPGAPFSRGAFDESPAVAASDERATPDAEPETGIDPNQTMVIIRPKGGLRIPGGQPSPAPPADEPAAPAASASPAGSAVPGHALPAAPLPAGVDEDSMATMVNRLPPVPAAAPVAPPPRPASSRPYGKPQPSEPTSDRVQTVPKPVQGQPDRRRAGAPPRRTPQASPAPRAPGPDVRARAPGPDVRAPHPSVAPPPPAPGTPLPEAAAQEAIGATAMDPATPENGLGTDLFTFQGTAPPRGSSPAGMIVLVAIALLGLAAIVMLVAAAVSNGGITPTGAKSLVESPPNEVAVSTSVQGGKTTPTGTPAPGLRRYIDRTGFIIDLPARLRGVAKGRSVGFSGEGDARTVRISRSADGTADVLGAVKAAEARAIAAGTYPGYKLIRLSLTTPPPYAGTDVADWEFTYTGGSGQVHVLSRWVAVPGAASYAIYWSTPETLWKKHRGQLDAVLSTFQPARRDPSGGS